MSRKMLHYVWTSYFLLLLKVLTVQNYDRETIMRILNESVSLGEDEWPFKVTNTMLGQIEQNLKYHEDNKWNIDIRAGFQIFFTKLNLKIALKHPRMKIYDSNDYTPIRTKRLERIVARADELNYFFRHSVLARVPRINMTRMLAALFSFTELPWFRFTPPIENDTRSTKQLIRIVNKKLQLNTFPLTPEPAEYDKNVIMEDDSSRNSFYIAQICMRELTRNEVNQTVLNETAPDVVIPPYKCGFPKRIAKPCHSFMERGFLNKSTGYEILFRIALLTAARVARNCYIFTPTKDIILINYLCLMARLESDLLNPKTFKAPAGYYEKDSLNRHDYATLCLLNGYKRFLSKDLLDCSSSTADWSSVGCYGRKDREPQNVSTPEPLWTIVRPNLAENQVCFRGLTASCLAHHSAVIRGLVELGDISEKRRPTSADGKPVTDPVGTTTEFDY